MIITNKAKLRAKCKNVSLFEAQDIIAQLENELNKTQGMGLASPQVDIQRNVCIIRTNNCNIDLVNPIIVEKYDKGLFNNEGCLSFPGSFVTTARYNEIVVKDLLNSAGLILIGLEAVIVQHEINHLNGELMYDFIIEAPKSRNSPCWCGKNGKKYKKCCLEKEIKER